MKIIKRLLYFMYYLKKLDVALFKKFVVHTKKTYNIGRLNQYFLVFYNALKYNISILEFYQFGFANKTAEEKKKWMGTGSMYELQKKDNPIEKRTILDDKRLFYQHYKEFFVHNVYKLEDFENDKTRIQKVLLENEKIVFKESDGKCGAGVLVKETKDFSNENMIKFMKNNHYDMVETFINQHSDIQSLSPSAVNTVRIFTRINSNGAYNVLGCRMRISVNSTVDNLAAGNLAAPIGLKTGKIAGPAVYSDITKPAETVHPITGKTIVGFQVPYWDEILEMVKKAHLSHPQNRSIGWDVVVTENGPGLIEGNHDWCKLVWQLPVNQGLKHLIN